MKRIAIAFAFLAAAAFAKDSCRDCHSALDGNLQAPAAAFANDVHSQHGFTCANCHGGDPTADDPSAAMSKAKGFIGKPARTAIPQLCAHCHSDAAFMHKYRPQQRVDQYALYQTSVHGKRLAEGDTAVAVCTDCHSVHDIREVKDPLAPVYPLRIPDTCGRCHSDPAHMARYKIPTNQVAEYKKSVHWEDMTKAGDLGAPSCASCHGNHGATPPQVSSVAEVCGSCHTMMADLYNKSPHQPVFAAMGEGSCTVCHSNHDINKPSPAMLAGPNAVCSQCHEADSGGGKAAAQMAQMIGNLSTAIRTSDAVLNRAHSDGMEVADAVLRQREANEDLVKAQVAVHAFDPAAVAKPIDAGLKIAAETRLAGEQALKERDSRRIGLGVSLIAIFITIVGLWFAIRLVESKRPPLLEERRS